MTWCSLARVMSLGTWTRRQIGGRMPARVTLSWWMEAGRAGVRLVVGAGEAGEEGGGVGDEGGEGGGGGEPIGKEGIARPAVEEGIVRADAEEGGEEAVPGDEAVGAVEDVGGEGDGLELAVAEVAG